MRIYITGSDEREREREGERGERASKRKRERERCVGIPHAPLQLWPQ